MLYWETYRFTPLILFILQICLLEKFHTKMRVKKEVKLKRSWHPLKLHFQMLSFLVISSASVVHLWVPMWCSSPFNLPWHPMLPFDILHHMPHHPSPYLIIFLSFSVLPELVWSSLEQKNVILKLKVTRDDIFKKS